ncbi:MAG: hypothetical protein A3I06_14655 [Candidatus Lindowbacteria bacterium RIFCSPLOWO2_02_FULL_62_12]|nr:MAG: hypothetical protein A3I06_14655 [Candidatus Lindowbacteria bacterium RIFCSPLOWO2_02_FULL_62_12]
MRSGNKFDVLYGRRPVQLFLEKSPRRPARLWIDRRLSRDVADKFSRLARGRSAAITPAAPGQLDRLTNHAVHQGVALEADPLRLRNVSDLFGLLSKSKIQNPKSKIAWLALDEVTDPQNFGAICRTAECFGLAGVLFETKTAPPLGGAAYKASAGALDFLPLFPVSSLHETLKTLKSKSVAIAGLDARAPAPLSRLSLGPAVVFVLGSEGRGIRPQIRSICDGLFCIPMRGRVGSLNVSAAAAAVCFHFDGGTMTGCTAIKT